MLVSTHIKVRKEWQDVFGLDILLAVVLGYLHEE